AQPQAARRAVELVVRAGDGAAEVLGDRRRLIQVLDNLVSNAIKFSSGGGLVEVEVGRRGEEVVVEVTDAGIGMTDEERGRLLEQVLRPGGALARQIPGTGLGLYTPRHIVEAHGGA